jgi:hypothetical protein
MITGFAPVRDPIPGPLVDTGSVVERECEVEIPGCCEDFGDGEVDGDGETVGEGEASITDGAGTAGATLFGDWVAAEVLRAYRLTLK